MQYRKGGFFTTGEWLLDANERTYPRFVEFLDPFSAWLAAAVRLELVAAALDEYGDILPDDEVLTLDEHELQERAEPPRLDADASLRIVWATQKRQLVTKRAQFDAIIGESIRIKGLRLVGRRDSPRLMLPTSEGLRLRPIELERELQREIIRRAHGEGMEPQPFAA